MLLNAGTGRRRAVLVARHGCKLGNRVQVGVDLCSARGILSRSGNSLPLYITENPAE